MTEIHSSGGVSRRCVQRDDGWSLRGANLTLLQLRMLMSLSMLSLSIDRKDLGRYEVSGGPAQDEEGCFGIVYARDELLREWTPAQWTRKMTEGGFYQSLVACCRKGFRRPPPERTLTPTYPRAEALTPTQTSPDSARESSFLAELPLFDEADLPNEKKRRPAPDDFNSHYTKVWVDCPESRRAGEELVIDAIKRVRAERELLSPPPTTSFVRLPPAFHELLALAEVPVNFFALYLDFMRTYHAERDLHRGFGLLALLSRRLKKANATSDQLLTEMAATRDLSWSLPEPIKEEDVPRLTELMQSLYQALLRWADEAKHRERAEETVARGALASARKEDSILLEPSCYYDHPPRLPDPAYDKNHPHLPHAQYRRVNESMQSRFLSSPFVSIQQPSDNAQRSIGP